MKIETFEDSSRRHLDLVRTVFFGLPLAEVHRHRTLVLDVQALQLHFLGFVLLALEFLRSPATFIHLRLKYELSIASATGVVLLHIRMLQAITVIRVARAMILQERQVAGCEPLGADRCNCLEYK